MFGKCTRVIYICTRFISFAFILKHAPLSSTELFYRLIYVDFYIRM